MVTASGTGQALLAIKWPSHRKTQLLPYLSSKLTITAKDAQGHLIAETNLLKGEATASLHLPGGTGYTLVVRADSDTTSNIAADVSAPFAIATNRSTQVQVELSPTIQYVAGAATALDADATAKAATLNQPGNLTLDGNDLLVADSRNNRIRRIAPDGTISTVAGGGSSAPALEPLATEALLSNPSSVHVDRDGNIWLLHSSKQLCVIPRQTGNIFGRQRLAGHLYPILTGTDTNPNITQLGFSMATEQSGRLLLVSPNERKIYRLSAPEVASISLTPVIGLSTGGEAPTSDDVDGVDAAQAAFVTPRGLAVDASDNLAIANTGVGNIVYFCRTAGTYFGKAMSAGKAYLLHQAAFDEQTQTWIDTPYRLAFDRDGNLYAACNTDHTIRKIDRATGTVSILAGKSGVGTSPDTGIALATRLGDQAPARLATLNSPVALCITSDNRLFVSDSQNHQIRRIHL